MKIYSFDIIFVFALAAFLMPLRAYAYVDPGAGSMILQLLLGGLAGLLVVGRLFRQKLLGLFGFGKHKDRER